MFIEDCNFQRSNQDLEYVVNDPDELAGLRVTQVSDNYVNWDSQRRSDYQQFILTEPHVNTCSRELYSLPTSEGYRQLGSSGRSENGKDRSSRLVRFPYEIRPYRPPRSCSFQ